MNIMQVCMNLLFCLQIGEYHRFDNGVLVLVIHLSAYLLLALYV